MRSNRFLAAAFCAFALFSLSAGAFAQGPWPSRPVRIVVPFPPGGPADGSARALIETMAGAIGQPMIVENLPGAGGITGTAAATRAGDGHTLLMTSTSATILPALRSDLQFDLLRDFEPVGMVSAQPLVLVVPAGAPHATLAELLREARAKPGLLTSGTSGNGTLSHLAIELLNGRQAVSITSVPYKGESALLPDILNGTLSMAFINLPITIPQVRSRKLRALAVSAAAPAAELPEVPTFAAQGVPGLVVEGWAALVAAKGIPAEALPKLEAALRGALAAPAVRERFAKIGVAPVSGTRAELREFLRAETERWGELVRARGIKVQ